jgi:nitroreductase
MTDFMNFLKTRRSIRKFQDKPLSDQALYTLLEAVQWSPSWSNTQCWELVAITDPDIKNALKDTLIPRNPATLAVANAPLVLALCGKHNSAGFYKDVATTKYGDWFLFDLGLAAQSLCLAAQSMGLGTVIVGAFDHNKANDILKTPAGYDVVVLIPTGYPDQDPPAPKRREISEFSHQNTF